MLEQGYPLGPENNVIYMHWLTYRSNLEITNNAKITQVDLIQDSVNPKVIAYVNQI
jgi:hypothetical protein